MRNITPMKYQRAKVIIPNMASWPQESEKEAQRIKTAWEEQGVVDVRITRGPFNKVRLTNEVGSRVVLVPHVVIPRGRVHPSSKLRATGKAIAFRNKRSKTLPVQAVLNITKLAIGA